MKTTNETTKKASTSDTPARSRKKISAEIIKLSELKTGEEIEGTFLGTSDRPWLDRQTGEEKIITQGLFEKVTGERFVAFMDAGAKNAVTGAGGKEGDYIILQKLEMKPMANGRRVNQYDVFSTEKPTLNS